MLITPFVKIRVASWQHYSDPAPWHRRSFKPCTKRLSHESTRIATKEEGNAGHSLREDSCCFVAKLYRARPISGWRGHQNSEVVEG